MIRSRFDLRAVLACGSLLLLAGCGGWYGEEEEPPLPGTRVPVMLLDEGVTADPRIGSLQVTLPPPHVNPEWAQVGGNATHAMQHLQLGDAPALAWRADIGAGSSAASRILAPPVVADGRVFTVDAAGMVSAFATADGARLWQMEPEGLEDSDRLRGGGLAFDTGWLFVTTGSGVVLGVDAESGRELWRRSLVAPIRTAPTSAGGRLFVMTSNNQLFALDARNGDVLWQHAGFFEPAAILGGAPPAVDGALVIAAYSSGEVFALEVATGRVVWTETVLRPRRTLAIGAINDITGAPVVDAGRVIVAGNGGELASLDLRSGARSYDVNLTSRNMPWVAGDFVYVLTDRNEVVALLRSGGRARWVSPLDRLVDPDDPVSRRIFWAGPVLAGDRLLLAGSTGEAVTVSPYTGEILGRIDLPGPVSLSPVVAAETAYFLTDDGTLLAYR